jgi:hypothetical protein
MPLEIHFLPPTLLALVFLAALILSMRPPEGFRTWLGWQFRTKSPADREHQFYDAFASRQTKLMPARLKPKVPGSGRGWVRNGRRLS